jgi:tyrosine-protein kinase Etk/Wzc
LKKEARKIMEQPVEPQSETKTPSHARPSDAGLSSMRLRDYAALLFAHTKFIGAFVLAGVALAAAVSLVMPRVYTAQAILMPPEDAAKQNLLLQSLGNAAGIGGLGALSNATNASDLLLDMLKSRTVAESLIVMQSLAPVLLSESQREKPEPEKTELALAALKETARFSSSKTGYLTIEVSRQTAWFSFSAADDDSARLHAAQMANGFVAALDKTNRRLANAKYLYNTSYVAAQIDIAKSELDSAFARFERFQKTRKAVSISDQMKLQLETAARLKAQILSEEVQLDLLQRDRQPSDFTVQETRTRLAELRRKYDELSSGRSGGSAMGFETAPALAREYAEYYREVKIQEEVYALLKQLYYKDRLQGFRDTPTVVALDSARIPFKRTSPKRVQLAAFAAAITFFMAIGVILFSNFLNRIRHDESYARLRETMPSLFGS